MSEPEASPTRTASPQVSRLPLLILRIAGANGYASMVNKFAKAVNSGSYSLADSHRFPFESRTLRVRHGETTVTFTICREPVSCFWLVLPYGRDDLMTTADVWDILFASDQCAYETRDEALEGSLFSLGYLAPWVGTAQGGYRVRSLRGLAEAKWMELWTDADDLDTRVCSGCEECGWDAGTRFHRIDLSGKIG